MKLLDSILGKIGLIRKSHAQIALIEGVSSSDPFTIWAANKKIAADKAITLNTSWVYACVRAIAEEIANIEFRLFRVSEDGASEEIMEHELLDLLYGVNQFMTGFELKYQTASHLELAGNAYWLLDGVEKESDKPTAIYPLNPKFIKVLKAELPEFITGYQYSIGDKKTTLKPYQILHFKYPDPNDPYEGIGTVQAIMDWISADNYASQVNLNYFKNGARLSGTLESDTFTTPEQLDYIKKSFQQLYASAANAYQIAALPKGVKYNPLSDTPKDMDFANLQQVMRDKILSGFRVPKTILGTSESETNRATAETANYVFAARTIKPKMQLIVSYLNEFLVPRYGENFYLDFVDPVPENRELQIQELQAGMANQPAISANEARERYFGLPPIANGDAVMTDFSKVPLGAPQETTKAKKPRAKTDGKAKPSTKYARSAKKRKEIANEIAEKAKEAVASLTKAAEELKKKDITDLSDDEYEVIYKAFATRVTPYQRALAERTRGFNKDQREEVLKNLPNAIKTKAVDADELFDKEKYVVALVDIAEPILTELYGKEGAAAAELLGQGGIDVLTPEVRKAIKRSVELMSGTYNEATLDLLKEKLEQGISQGASFDELKELVKQVYEFSDEVRSERVAVTETFRIANDATHEAWKQSEVVKTIKWYTAADERVCPFCAPLHGKVIGIDEKFYEKGETITAEGGKTLDLDYEDVSDPPLHVSCRCYIRPEEISLAAPAGETKEPEPLKVDLENLIAEAVRKHLEANKEAVKSELAEMIKQDLESAKVEITTEIAAKIDKALENEQ